MIKINLYKKYISWCYLFIYNTLDKTNYNKINYLIFSDFTSLTCYKLIKRVHAICSNYIESIVLIALMAQTGFNSEQSNYENRRPLITIKKKLYTIKFYDETGAENSWSTTK